MSKYKVGSMPWDFPSFSGWEIVGMNHYHMKGERRLYVAMIKTGTNYCIQADGDNGDTDREVWEHLAAQAEHMNNSIYKI
jgi:hypothetical protein